MAGTRGFLDRFRTSGTPGAAAGAGVPADRVTERDIELASVFARIEPVEALAAQIRADGRAQAEQRRQSGADESSRLLAQARRDAAAERRDAAARIAAQAATETNEALQAADDEAAAIAARADHTVPALTESVLAQVAARLGVDPAVFGARP